MFTNDENKKKEDIFKILIRLSDLSQNQLNKILIEKNIDFKSSDFDYIDFFSSFESLYEINLLIDQVQNNKVMNENLKKDRKRLKELNKKELSEILGVNPNLGFSKAQLIDQIINKKRDEDEINNAIFNNENIFELVGPIYNKFFGNLNNYEISPNLKSEVKYYDFLDQIDNDYKEYLLDKEIFDFLLENLDHGFHVEYSLSKSFKNILKTNNLSIEDGRYLLKRILYDYINGDIDSCEKLKDEYIESIKHIEDLKTHIYKRETQILKLFTRHREDFQRYVDLKEKTSTGKIDKLNNFFNENISKIKKFNNKMLYFNDTYFSCSKRDELIWEYDEIYNQLPSSDLDFFKLHLDNFDDLIQFKEIFEDLYYYEGLTDEKQNYIKLANERYIEKELELNKDFFEDILNYSSEIEYEKSLEKEKISLDEEQRRAVVIDEDNVQIVAGAGTGKTTVLQAKLKYLTKIKGIDEEKILCLSFSNAAVDDLKKKIDLILGPNQVDIRNFHSLGGEILKDSNLNARIHKYALDEAIDLYFKEEILHDKEKIKKILEFFSYYFYIPISELENDISEKYEYEEMVNTYTIKDTVNKFINNLDDENRFNYYRKIYGKDDAKITEKRERVRSIEELAIANFLFLNGIDYEYERKFPIEKPILDDSGENNSRSTDYYPDFYLPKYDIHIEHFGVDENCEADWIGNEKEAEKYKDSIFWKRKIFEMHNKKLIETYSYYTRDRRLLKRLEEKLKDEGVEFNEIDPVILYETLTSNVKLKQFNDFSGLIKTFINLFKGNGFSIYSTKEKFNEFKMKNNIKDSFVRQRREIFLELVEDIFDFYQEYLKKIDKIDFNDMINDAIKELGVSKNIREYEYVLIDEYQDTSKTRYGLIKAIKDIYPGTKLIVVGDDWQSIYKFTGCNIKLFTEFYRYFDEPELVKIQKTYRNSQQLLDVSGNFMNNDEQIQKKLVSSKSRIKPIKILEYKDTPQKILAFEEAIKRIVKDYDESDNDEELEILVLGRNNHDIKKLIRNNLFYPIEYDDYLKIIYNKNEEYKKINITFRTIHKSKGLDAPYVILINLENGVTGFPNKIGNDEIIDFCFEENKETIPYAEERRLFYVALTRTKNDVYLLVPETEESSFVKELRENENNKEHLEEIKLDFNEEDCQALNLDWTSADHYINTHLKCPICSGTVRLVNSGNFNFFSCSHYACTWFGGYYNNKIEELKFCENCTECGGILIVKENSSSGKYFLGCTFWGSEKCGETLTLDDEIQEEIRKIREAD